MKNVLFLFLAAFSLTVAAQDKLTEGVITSKQTVTSENAEVQAQLDMMGKLESTTYFKGLKSRTELSNPMSGDIVTITNGDTKEIMMLMDNMMGKTYTYQKQDSLDDKMKNIKVIAGDKTKKVLGYECKQYTVTIKQDGVDMTMEMFTTEAIPVASQQTAMLGDKLKGFPLYMTMTMNQMGMEMLITTEVTEIKKDKVSDDLFSMTPPEGYTKAPGQ
ncbi:DUF4412 domain-containing protein [Psychroserpens sp. SPM9]|uniref:DUF4412 domain-containing protein n=1 Tax=Psychroserpens sp. SPM9 TaxID=2975598 RepID=UPI0021A707A3|nr:DUF4412 domain-containing protein [Psychroserpens sp. SPM9]MDG5493085.1 DUF4412 domain-containing protein [Psychroserpens sp. SPM9]